MLRKLILENDSDTESPNDIDGAWKLYSFSTRHNSFKHPENFDPVHNPGLRSKFRAGLAHWLSYYEHGNCLWQLKYARHIPGSDCPWDSVEYAGIVIFEGPAKDFKATPEKRKESAIAFVDEYSKWCNGECYYYRLEDKDGNHIDSCGGFIGLDYMGENINEHLNDDDRILPAGVLADSVKYIKGLKGEIIDQDEWDEAVEEQPEFSI